MIPFLPVGQALEITANPMARLSRIQAAQVVAYHNDATTTLSLAIRAARKLESTKTAAFQRSN